MTKRQKASAVKRKRAAGNPGGKPTNVATFDKEKENSIMRRQDKQPPKTKKYFRSTKSGAGMTKAGVARYRRENPGSKLKTAVTGKVKKGF